MKWLIGILIIGGAAWWLMQQQNGSTSGDPGSVTPSPAEKKPDPVDPFPSNNGVMDPVSDPVPLPERPIFPSGPVDVPRGVEGDDGPVISPIITMN